MKKLIRTTRNSGKFLFLLVITICYLTTAKVGEIKVFFLCQSYFIVGLISGFQTKGTNFIGYIYMAHVLDESYFSFGASLKESFSLVSGCGCSSYTNIVIILLVHSLKYM
ncbi:hypothetical protein IHE45_15G033900 [Dioscorea alata]|uniref:Uncharacterized protein n=1 Tax=Dioscorea alata TaxID=55571 RepID=A0ACB7UKR6_DIOAL|nr:hypothetical protein IHE45_15G033900 [Dioscorea alata]